MKRPTVRQIETARHVLMWQSESSSDGRLRDAIGLVRFEWGEELDRRESTDSEADR
ncbi:hypothetical protein [Aeromicrobium sp. CTD01-1L150]|uniref:hypothetical protein n=1 Tax=Aeromicrobium sp. CTD01-1L150 TaxID=3341830 RepID=UPI0035C255EC